MLARSKDGKDSNNGNFMTDGQLADYLADLRTSRAARVNGSRPQTQARQNDQDRTIHSSRSAQNLSSQYTGFPLVPEPLKISSQVPKGPELRASSSRSTLASNIANAPYVETGARWMDRQEARSLRMALEDMDVEEEKRIHEAAQDEASQLVLQHRNPSMKHEGSAYTNPDAPKRDYKMHLRKDNYGGRHGPIHISSNPTVTGHNDTPSSAEPKGAKEMPLSKSPEEANIISVCPDAVELPGDVPAIIAAPKKKKSYQGLASAVAADIASMSRRVSSGSRRKASSEKKMFPTAEDRIYEEPGPEPIKEEPEPIKEEPKPIKEREVAEPPSLPPQRPSSTESTTDELPRHVRKNPFARVRLNKDNLERANSIASGQTPRFNPVEIQKNPPSQSRRPWYTSNKPASTPAIPIPPVPKTDAPIEEEINMKDGKEVRSEDIRAATSMKRIDRSPHLPQPTAVSDCPGRPIVSFTNNWKQREAERESSTSKPSIPAPGRSARPTTASTSALPVDSKTTVRSPPGPTSHVPSPTFPPKHSPSRPQAATQSPTTSSRVSLGPAAVNIPNGIPILNLPEDDEGSTSKTLSEEPDVPQLDLLGTNTESKRPLPLAKTNRHRPSIPIINIPTSIPETPEDLAPTRPLPVPQAAAHGRQTGSRGEAHGTHVAPLSTPHFTPMHARNGALCAHCALPIAGRILSAAGERFHPECFRCHQCGINLECVAFYPEPDQKYYERIARIQHRMQGYRIDVPEGVTEADVRRLEEEDGDESMRFFCHLDFHELFSPRCRSCKTPIEGEVVVACGAEWHVGHFFCAQCGDPFDSSMPFVEKDGYAWCLGCHTHRYSSKCKKCRKPITDVVVNALDHDWHSHCFCCAECGGGFDDGQYFLRGDSMDPVCVRCEDRRLKA